MMEFMVTCAVALGFIAGRAWQYWWSKDGRESRDYWQSYAKTIEKSNAALHVHCVDLEAENRSLRDWATDTIDTCPIKEQDMPF